MSKITNQEQGFAHLWLMIVAVLVMVSGVGIYVARHNAQPKHNSATELQNTSTIKPLSTNLGGLLTVDKVKQLATEDKPGTSISQVGLVQTARGPVFHIQLEDGSSLDLDAKTGTKVEDNEVDNNSEGSQLPTGFTPAIDFAKAEQIAQTKVSQGAIMRIQLEVEEGVPTYSVRFSTGARVEINANDGTVVKVDAAKAQAKQPTTSTESPKQPSGKISTSSRGISEQQSGSVTKTESISGDSTTETSSSGSTTSQSSGRDTSNSTSGSTSGSGSHSGSGSDDGGGH